MYKYFYREAEREEEEEDKVQIQKKDKQRERERVTQLGVRGDNGIITLIYNNIHPPPPDPPPNPIWFALFSQNAVIKCLIAAKPALMR